MDMPSVPAAGPAVGTLAVEGRLGMLSQTVQRPQDATLSTMAEAMVLPRAAVAPPELDMQWQQLPPAATIVIARSEPYGSGVAEFGTASQRWRALCRRGGGRALGQRLAVAADTKAMTTGAALRRAALLPDTALGRVSVLLQLPLLPASGELLYRILTPFAGERHGRRTRAVAARRGGRGEGKALGGP